MGEIGLAGELRRVRDLPQRLAEAARLGFRMAVVPGEPGAVDNSRAQTGRQVDGMQVLDVSTVLSALRAAQVTNADGRATQSPRLTAARVSASLGRNLVAVERTDDTLRLRATLAAIAPGTALRDGLERILRGRTGALIVLGNDKTVDSIATGGFTLDVPFTATGLRELAKMDGAIIVDKDITRIHRAAVHLMPDHTIPSEETGTRHRTADRVARQTGFPVISVSQSMQIIAAYVGDIRHVLEDSGQILSRANQALATLERYKMRLDEVSSTLSALEIEDLVTVRDVAVVAQRLEMVTRIAREIDDYVLELGTDGRLLSLQLEELITGVDAERELVVRDYLPTGSAARPAPSRASTTSPTSRPPTSSTRVRSRASSASGRASTSTARSPRAATACSPRCRGCRPRSSTVSSSTSVRSRSCSRPASTTSRPSRVSVSSAPAACARDSPASPSRASSSATSDRAAGLPQVTPRRTGSVRPISSPPAPPLG